MKIRGQRILVFGDDYSVQGDDKAPGAILAQLLLEQGAQVQLDAAKGRSAVSFWMPQHEGQDPPDQLIAQDIAFDPTQVIVMLGSNDLGLDTQADTDAFTALKQSFPKAEVWAVGPPNFADPNMNTQAAVVYQTLTNVFGADHVIDLRPLTIHADRTSDGIHFTPASAALIAQGLASTFSAASPLTWGKAILWGLGIGAAVAAGLYLLRRESKTLEGMNMVMDAAGEEEIEIEDGEEIGIDPDDPNIIDAKAVDVESITGLGRPMLAAPRAMKISTKDPATMTASAINKELDKLSARSSELTDEFIAAGRGHERPSDIEHMTDPLAVEQNAIWNRTRDLRNEIELRYGPGAPSRFPTWDTKYRGYFKPRKTADGLEGSKETPVAMVRFASNDARSRFLKAYRERLSEAGYEPHQIPDVIWAQFSEPGLTAYISGTDDIDRVRDVAHEVRGVFVKDRPDLAGPDVDAEMAEQSLSEEEHAIEDYGKRAGKADDPDLRRVFEHNRGEEEHHAELIEKWQHEHGLAGDPYLDEERAARWREATEKEQAARQASRERGEHGTKLYEQYNADRAAYFDPALHKSLRGSKGDRVVADLESWGVDAQLIQEVRDAFARGDSKRAIELARDLGWTHSAKRGRAPGSGRTLRGPSARTFFASQGRWDESHAQPIHDLIYQEGLTPDQAIKALHDELYDPDQIEDWIQQNHDEIDEQGVSAKEAHQAWAEAYLTASRDRAPHLYEKAQARRDA